MTTEETRLLDALAATRKTDVNKLHELESSDVAISPEALAALGRAARPLLSRVMDVARAREMTLGEILKLFVSKIYWNEAGGELIMCACFGTRALCLPIAAEHWDVRITGRLH